MTAPLTVHNAEIKTAAVEIRTLTISGKQVTLSVFRQLQDSDLVGEDGTLLGVPWGSVNYHPDKVRDREDSDPWSGRAPKLIPCQRAALHLHVVWQEGAELRRSLVFNPRWYARNVADWGGPDDPQRIGYTETWRSLCDLPQLFIAV